MTNNPHAFLRSRRSIRQYTGEPIPRTVIQGILETATYAPSAHNKQPWRFVVLISAVSKSRLAEAVTDQFQREMTVDGEAEADIRARVEKTIRKMNEAPAAIVLCRDITQVVPQKDKSRQAAERIMGIQSVALAGLQLLLAAHAEGIGGVWICWPLFTPEATRRALELPAEWEPQGMIFLGYSAEAPTLPERKPIQEIVRYL